MERLLSLNESAIRVSARGAQPAIRLVVGLIWQPAFYRAGPAPGEATRIRFACYL